MKSKLFRALALAGVVIAALSYFGDAQAASTLSPSKVQFAFSGGMAGGPALGTTQFTLSEGWVTSLATGTGANQATKIYVASASTTTTVDLDSSLTFADGSTGSFSRIVAVGILAGSSNSANLKLGGDFILTKYLIPGADTLSAVTIPIHPNGAFSFVAPNATGVAITATTGDELTITVTGSDTFKLVVFGS